MPAVLYQTLQPAAAQQPQRAAGMSRLSLASPFYIFPLAAGAVIRFARSAGPKDRVSIRWPGLACLVDCGATESEDVPEDLAGQQLIKVSLDPAVVVTAAAQINKASNKALTAWYDGTSC